MPNPLSILAGLAGGLSTIGAEGAGGALQGQVEGEQLKRKFASEDLQNQLRVLDSILKGQQVEQARLPTTDINGNRIINRAYPSGPVTGISELPETAGQRATRESAEATAGLHRAQTGQVGVPTDPTHTWQKKFGDAIAAGDQAGADQAMSVLKRFSEIHAIQGAPKVHFDKSTDANGNVTYLVASQKPDGTWKLDQIPLGKIGHAPASSAGLVPRETVTNEERITPRKQIKDQNKLNALNAAVPDVVNELSRKPGFNVAGGYVEIRQGVRVRKEDIIAQAFKQRFGAEVSVRWNGSKFIVVDAWEPEQREPIRKTRTVGPPSTTPPERDEED